MPDSKTQLSRVAERISIEIHKLPVVDTHSHIVREADFISGTFDFSHILIGSYSPLDMGSVGMRRPRGVLDIAYESLDPIEKWRLMAPYWPKIRSTRFSICARRAFKHFFNVDDLDERACLMISERMRDYQYEGVYARYLQQESDIHVTLRVLVNDRGGEPQYFAPIFYLDPIAGPPSRDCVEDLLLEAPPARFDDYLAILGSRLEESKANGAVALKIGEYARWQMPNFIEHAPSETEASYRFLLENYERWDSPGVLEKLRPFHDTCYRFCFVWAAKNDMPVQVHSGLEFEQPWSGRPTAYIPLLREFRDTRFAFLHGSYPYLDELTGLARSFHNVTIDMAWLTLLSGPILESWLSEWLEVLSPSKLMAFGGDSHTFFETCTNLDMTREMLVSVLAKRVKHGSCSQTEAVELARQLLHDSSWEYYGLENRWARFRKSRDHSQK